MQQKTPAIDPFSLNLGTSFGSRADDVFGSLGNIEAKHDAYSKARSTSREGKLDLSLLKTDPRDEEPMSTSSTLPLGRPRQASPTKPSDFNKCEFKRPRALPPKRGRQRESDKWTYYNLGDVSKNDLSERSNTAAALSFLRTQQSRKRQKITHEEEAPMDTDTRKHVFKKVSPVSESEDAGPKIQIAGRPGCRVLPEYVIGQKPGKKTGTKVKTTKTSSKKVGQVSIGHLMDEEEDDEDMVLEKQASPSFVAKPKCKPSSTRTICHSDEEEGQDLAEEAGKFSFVALKRKGSAQVRSRDAVSSEDEEPVVGSSTDEEREVDLDGID